MKRYGLFLLLFCWLGNSYAQNRNQQQLQHLENVLNQEKAKADAQKRKEMDAKLQQAINDAVRNNKYKVSQTPISENTPDIYILTIDGTDYRFDNLAARDRAKNDFIYHAARDAISSFKNSYPNQTVYTEANIKAKINNKWSVRQERNPNYRELKASDEVDIPPKPVAESGGRETIFRTSANTLQPTPKPTPIEDSTMPQRKVFPKSQPLERKSFSELTVNMQIQDKSNMPAPEELSRKEIETEYEKQKRFAEQKEEQYENEKAQRFDVDLLKSQKEALEAKYWEGFNNCIKYNIKSDCIGQFKPIKDKIEVIEKRIESREEWLEKINNMSPEALKAQEKNYEKLTEMAGLAEYSYKEKEGLPDGWKEVYESRFSTIISEANDNIWGFHCELLQNDAGKYVLSFRGTELNSGMIEAIKDGGTDALGHITNLDFQTQAAKRITEKILAELGDAKQLELTGHSLGGRLAAEAAITNNLTAYTFDAADISLKSKNEMNANNKANILNTVSANDFVTDFLDVGLGSSKGGVNMGKTMSLQNDHYTAGYTNVIKEAYGNKVIGSASFEAHSITFLRQALEQRYQDIKKLEQKY